MTRYEVIYSVVRKIPRGRVATYGQIAEIAGMGGHARVVGYAMHALPKGSKVPWHRVLSATARISLPAAGGRRQRALLEAEGVRFLPSGKIDFDKFRWKPARSMYLPEFD